MIVEGLLTTTNSDGSPHVAPMGPVVDPTLTHWQLRPFQTSSTFVNLRRDGTCVFHVIDDVVPLVQSALSLPTALTYQAVSEGGWRIESACHWYCLEAVTWDLRQERAEVSMQINSQGVQRPFWGWNRAKHAILEATILATRLHLTGADQVRDELVRFEGIVNKTAGPRELHAWAILRDYIDSCRV
jgi:uncharacterized protein